MWDECGERGRGPNRYCLESDSIDMGLNLEDTTVEKYVKAASRMTTCTCMQMEYYV